MTPFTRIEAAILLGILVIGLAVVIPAYLRSRPPVPLSIEAGTSTSVTVETTLDFASIPAQGNSGMEVVFPHAQAYKTFGATLYPPLMENVVLEIRHSNPNRIMVTIYNRNQDTSIDPASTTFTIRGVK